MGTHEFPSKGGDEWGPLDNGCSWIRSKGVPRYGCSWILVKEGGDWGEVKKLPPWMWQDTQTSERFRATGDFFTIIGNDSFIRQQF